MNELCFTTDLTSGELAAWVQAWGTVVAVVVSALVALGVTAWQHSREIKREEQRARQLAGIYGGLAKTHLEEIHYAFTVSNAERLATARAKLEVAIDVGRHIDLVPLTDALAVSVVKLRAALAKAEALNAQWSHEGPTWSKRAEVFAAIIKEVNEIIATMDRLLKPAV